MVVNGVKEEGLELVSIITPAYNSEKFISDTIESVINQTHRNWEMIIVDDYSTDGTVDIINKYQSSDSRIKLIQLEQNSGPAIARNTAIQHAKGRYLAFLDSDDQWLSEKLEKQIRFMKDKQIAFSFSNYFLLNEEGEEIGSIDDAPQIVSYQQLLKHNMIGCLTVMIDKNRTGEVKMMDIRSRQDYVLWLSLCKRGFQAFGIQEKLAKYRVVENSLSSNKIKMAKQNWKVYREIEKLSLLKSGWYFFNYLYFKFKKYGTK
ncbi:glycosyltransferase family 2 protein [Evansella tamaricis]|uniref:Glycosyltransferase family 2 protein n=1 Tax=Evansella tamaricis TaxID=2069301 RepID=A0ABS6JH07_9BACI|nr:glycosyltransferase family 2 protein [Evansella tamaricis]MBU9712945.1 glycosyltransferase family 2 protein [Evansella tamaricis]